MTPATRILVASLACLFSAMGLAQSNPADTAPARTSQDGGSPRLTPKTAAVQADARARKVARDLQGAFLWLGSAPEGRQAYAAFRKRFELAEVPRAALLHLFADSRYTLWINGQYVDRGRCPRIS